MLVIPGPVLYHPYTTIPFYIRFFCLIFNFPVAQVFIALVRDFSEALYYLWLGYHCLTFLGKKGFDLACLSCIDSACFGLVLILPVAFYPPKDIKLNCVW